MPNDIHITVTIEELHLHGLAVETGAALADLAAGAGVEPEPSVGASRPSRTGQSYDIRDRPSAAVVLETVAESDGVTAGAIEDMTDIPTGTVTSALHKFEGVGALDSYLEDDTRFYTITALGERILDDYREQWRQGYWKLPHGYWNGIVERD